MSSYFGQQVNENDLTTAFLEGPGQFIVLRLLQQMAKVKPFADLFGPLTVGPVVEGSALDASQRWADYSRQDWSLRQLPVVNLYESGSEDKQSSNAYLTGELTLAVFWPASLRRSDWARVPAAFRGAILNFLESDLVQAMLDEHYSVERPEKVPGLNELGKNVTWSPVVEGLVESEMVPVTMVSIKYRVDLRSWYRYLEHTDRTKEQPFDKTLSDLTLIRGEYDGIPATDVAAIEAIVEDKINVQSP